MSSGEYWMLEPWEVFEAKNDYEAFDICSQGTVFATVWEQTEESEAWGYPEELATALLMAAAPDLLRACRTAIAYLADPPSEFAVNRQVAAEIIRDAIVKATGGKP